jgi:hypothetical protein
MSKAKINITVYMIKKYSFLFFLLIYVAGVYGQTAKYSNEFLSLGIGARGLAMSGALAASTNDGYSSYWNPAGLVYIAACSKEKTVVKKYNFRGDREMVRQQSTSRAFDLLRREFLR